MDRAQVLALSPQVWYTPCVRRGDKCLAAVTWPGALTGAALAPSAHSLRHDNPPAARLWRGGFFGVGRCLGAQLRRSGQEAKSLSGKDKS
jgi:hypothetical protein